MKISNEDYKNIWDKMRQSSVLGDDYRSNWDDLTPELVATAKALINSLFADRESLPSMRFSMKEKLACSADHVYSVFFLAGIEIISLTKTDNRYMGSASPEVNINSPWWEVETKYGIVVFGWRKRVAYIGWEKTKAIIDVTKDDVTKDGYSVHAWSYADAVKYLTSWNEKIRLLKRQEQNHV